jgi:hypothetical protein
MHWFTLLTGDILGSIAFGESYGLVEKEEVGNGSSSPDFMTLTTQQKSQIIKDIETCMLLIGIRIELRPIYELIKNLPLPVIGKPVELFDHFEEYGSVAVRNSKAAAKSNVRTLFSKMLNEDGTQAFSDHVLKQESANLIVAGVDTTAMTLTYLTYAVLRNPEVKRKLTEELSMLPDNYSWDDLEAKPYLNRVITETLRWNPSIAGSLPRSAPKEGAVLAGYVLPGHTVVSTQAHTLHHELSIWPQPER